MHGNLYSNVDRRLSLPTNLGRGDSIELPRLFPTVLIFLLWVRPDDAPHWSSPFRNIKSTYVIVALRWLVEPTSWFPSCGRDLAWRGRPPYFLFGTPYKLEQSAHLRGSFLCLGWCECQRQCPMQWENNWSDPESLQSTFSTALSRSVKVLVCRCIVVGLKCIDVSSHQGKSSPSFT